MKQIKIFIKFKKIAYLLLTHFEITSKNNGAFLFCIICTVLLRTTIHFRLPPICYCSHLRYLQATSIYFSIYLIFNTIKQAEKRIANIRLTMNNGYCLQKTVKYTYAMQHITKNSIDGLDETDNDYIYYYSVKFVN